MFSKGFREDCGIFDDSDEGLVAMSEKHDVTLSMDGKEIGRFESLSTKKTLREWADQFEQVEGITILDPDGFDRTDPKMWERLYTREEFENGLMLCTVKKEIKGAD